MSAQVADQNLCGKRKLFTALADHLTMSVMTVGDLYPLLERLGATEHVRLLQQLNLWTASLHQQSSDRVEFPAAISELAPDQLSDLQSRIVHSASSLFELLGLFRGLHVQQTDRVKRARTTARNRVRTNWPADRKPPTKTEVDDLSQSDPSVEAEEERLADIGTVLASLNEMEKRLVMQRETISREITYRSEQMRARLY